MAISHPFCLLCSNLLRPFESVVGQRAPRGLECVFWSSFFFCRATRIRSVGGGVAE